MVRFLHTSDWQIGMKGGGLGKAGTRVAEERINTVDRVLTIAEEHDVDFVIVAGDVFEDNRVSYADIESVARIIHSHPDVEIHVIPGNHDLPGPGSVWNRSALRGVRNLTVHLSSEPVEVRDGVILHPFPVLSRYTGTDPLAVLPDLRADRHIHIAIAHGHITTVTFGGTVEGVVLPIDPTHVQRTGLDYLALGHWHSTRLITESTGECRIAYSGTHEQTSYEETDAGNVLIVEIEGKGALPKISKIRAGKLRWGNEQLEFVADENLDRLKHLLETADFDLLRLELSGELPGSLYPEYGKLLEEAGIRFLDLRVRDDRLRWRREEEALAFTDALLEEVARRLRTIEGNKGDPVAREALRLLHEFAREAGI